MINTFFEELVEKSGIILDKERIYQITNKVSNKDFFQIGEHKFGIVRSVKLSEIDRLYRNLNAEKIFEYKKKFIERRIKEKMRTSKQMEKYKTTHFILYRIFPLFMENESEVDSLIKGEEIEMEREEENIDELIEERLVSDLEESSGLYDYLHKLKLITSSGFLKFKQYGHSDKGIIHFFRNNLKMEDDLDTYLYIDNLINKQRAHFDYKENN